MKDNRDKIIELLKIECGLKGELVNMVLQVPGLNEVMETNNILPTLQNCILEINKIHDQVVKLEMVDESDMNVKTTKN